jgi:hypothetical protein
MEMHQALSFFCSPTLSHQYPANVMLVRIAFLQEVIADAQTFMTLPGDILIRGFAFAQPFLIHTLWDPKQNTILAKDQELFKTQYMWICYIAKEVGVRVR